MKKSPLVSIFHPKKQLPAVARYDVTYKHKHKTAGYHNKKTLIKEMYLY